MYACQYEQDLESIDIFQKSVFEILRKIEARKRDMDAISDQAVSEQVLQSLDNARNGEAWNPIILLSWAAGQFNGQLIVGIVWWAIIIFVVLKCLNVIKT